jgi:hypothetical protein
MGAAVPVAGKAWPAPNEYPMPRPGEPVFLLERSAVEDFWNVRRKLNPLVRSARNPIIRKDRDWEGHGPYLYGTVLYDAKDKLFKCWYTVAHEDAFRKNERGSYMTCYAVSRDGYAWRKPELGLVEWNGNKNNNFVQLGVKYNAPLTVVPIPDECGIRARYAGLYLDLSSVRLAYSDNGLVWREFEGNPIDPRESDAHNSLVYDPTRRNWMVHMRPPLFAHFTKRRIAIMESPDLRTWTRPATVLLPDEEDLAEFYGMPVFRRGNLFFGLLQVYNRYG